MTMNYPLDAIDFVRHTHRQKDEGRKREREREREIHAHIRNNRIARRRLTFASRVVYVLNIKRLTRSLGRREKDYGKTRS